MKTLMAIVSGRVQGVWFRGSTQSEAHRLKVFGYAKNLPDGTVEVLMQGKDTDVEELLAWLHHGPETARVDHVAFSAEAPRGDLTGFRVL